MAFKILNMKHLRFSVFLLIIFFYLNETFAHEDRVDRRPMVEAAFSHMQPMLKLYVANVKKDKTLQPEEISFLNNILTLLEQKKIELNYQYDPKYFELANGQAPRLMSTNPSQLERDIYVNLNLLEAADSRDIDLILIFKFLFHEVAHKTQFGDVAVRDRLASMFARFLESFYQEYLISDELKIMVLSASLDVIDIELAPTSINLAQPTFIILGNQRGNITDFTSHFANQLGSMTSNTRSLWNEVLRGFFSVAGELASFVGSIQSELESILSQLVGQSIPKDSINVGEIRVEELRKLEVQNIKHQELSPGRFILIVEAYYKIERSHKNTGHVRINGLPVDQHSEFPIHARLLINVLNGERIFLDDFNFVLFQNVDFSTDAKVRQVSRSGENTLVKIKFPVKDVIDKEVYLIANYHQGYLSVPPEAIETQGKHKVATFFVPPYITSSQKPYLADKVVINSEKVLPLDRVVSLNSILDFPKEFVKSPTSLVSGSAGFWGVVENQKKFRTQFSHLEVTPFFDLSFMQTDHFYLKPNDMNMEFSLLNSTGVREVRLHFSRQIHTVKVEPGKPVLDFDSLAESQIDSLGLGIKTRGLRLAEGGIFNGEKRTRETYIITHDRIQQTLSDRENEHKVTAKFQIPFKLIKDNLDVDEAYLLPFFIPHSVEVVLADGGVVVHNFSQILDDEKMSCNEIFSKFRASGN